MRCFFGFHRWTKWKRDPNREILRVYSNGLKGIVGYFQDRECQNCGIAERKKVYSE